MIIFFKRIFGFIKENPSILYSLVLIIFLPLILWWNTFFTIKSFERNIDFTLQTKALAIENTLAELVSDKIDSPDILQEKIEKISKENPEIKKLRVIVFEEDKFKILASQDKKEIGEELSDPSLAISWHQNQNIAHLMGSSEERFWSLIKPVFHQGKKVGLVSMALSLKATDLLITKAIYYSYLVVIVAILISLFLVLQHTRLFEYLKLYKELRKIEKMRESFFRMAIHELQSPIVNIRGYIEALEEELGPSLSITQKEQLSRISLSAKNLSELVYDILEVVRIERGALDISLKQIFPQKIVKEVVDFLRPKAEAKNLTFIYSQKELPWTIKVNPHRFREILNNLIENAIKYTKRGKIEVKEWVDEVKEIYYISVEDTGIGISGEEQKRLFEKFYRVKNRDTAGIPGTGLGLWIVKNLCEKMKGGIVVESIKGVGSKFTVYFPATKI
jgi:signal transduction histidine kinase